MTKVRAIVTSKFLVAAAIVAIGVAVYVASVPSADAVIGPGVCTYYKDATYKKVVGARGTGCCGAVINWGVTSAYKRCEVLYCTDQVCPN